MSLESTVLDLISFKEEISATKYEPSYIFVLIRAGAKSHLCRAEKELPGFRPIEWCSVKPLKSKSEAKQFGWWLIQVRLWQWIGRHPQKKPTPGSLSALLALPRMPFYVRNGRIIPYSMNFASWVFCFFFVCKKPQVLLQVFWVMLFGDICLIIFCPFAFSCNTPSSIFPSKL